MWSRLRSQSSKPQLLTRQLLSQLMTAPQGCDREQAEPATAPLLQGEVQVQVRTQLCCSLPRALRESPTPPLPGGQLGSPPPCRAPWAPAALQTPILDGLSPPKSFKKPFGNRAGLSDPELGSGRELPRPTTPCWSLPKKGQEKPKPLTFTMTPGWPPRPQGPLRQVPLAFWVAATSPSAPQDGACTGRGCQ